VKTLHAAGVRILAGTDAPMPQVYPGFALHKELELLVEAGLSPADALRSATIWPAEFLGLSDSIGSITTGKRADLLLLDGNPLSDISQTHRIRAVVLDGRVLQRTELDRLLSAATGGDHLNPGVEIPSDVWFSLAIAIRYCSRNSVKSHLLVCFLIGVASPVCGAEDVQLGNNSIIHFASMSEGRKVLTTKDEFVRHLSPFDRSARMKVDRPVPEDEFLTFVGKNVSEWTADETKSVEESLKNIKALLQPFALSFPATIQMIKTTGAEEGNAAYTRGTAIMIPNALLAQSQKELTKLLCHELFHVLSRKNPELREELYGIIGFSRCDDLEFPRELASRKITNPDAPRNDHSIRLQIEGKQCAAVPILFSSTATYDVKRGGEFFNYLSFQFLVIEEGSLPHSKVVYENSAPKLVEPRAVSGFFEQVGRNTEYIIHPEEILADNFALLILGEQNVPSVEILEKLKNVLTRKPKS
jgi:Amidohydrolase family